MKKNYKLNIFYSAVKSIFMNSIFKEILYQCVIDCILQHITDPYADIPFVRLIRLAMCECACLTCSGPFVSM